MDTKDLILSCINRDESAFRILVDTYSDFAFSVAHRLVNDEEESKDIVQESFISIWKHIGSFRIEKNFSHWLYKIVVNKCYDSLRSKKRMALNSLDQNSHIVADIFSENNPEAQLNNKEIGRIIRLLTKSLSPKQKIVFILGEVEGLSHDDISEITGMQKTSVKSNLHHARIKIRSMIEKYV